jgi:hypothetical protein
MLPKLDVAIHLDKGVSISSEAERVEYLAMGPEMMATVESRTTARD